MVHVAFIAAPAVRSTVTAVAAAARTTMSKDAGSENALWISTPISAVFALTIYASRFMNS
jgi:hypothetical protein